MLHIGKSYIRSIDGMTRLCADLVLNGHINTLWFAVAESQKAYLSVGRADPFVMALLPMAMHGNKEIVCEDPMSERLHWQLCTDLMPALASVGTWYHRISIFAPLTPMSGPCGKGVGTGFSGGVDSLYSILRHGPDSECPLTHLAVFNSGVFEGESYHKNFLAACRAAGLFAKEIGLETIFVDTNFNEMLPERFLDVYSFRNLACALAVSPLFSVYLLSSGHDMANFNFDLHNAASYDALTVYCASTENTTFYLSGAEVKRWEKIKALTEWEHSFNWLHPCIYGLAGGRNCGHCKKCSRDLTTLYALDALDKYEAVVDVPEYRKHVAARIGFVFANRGNHLYDETLALLQFKHVPIPPAAYIYEKQFRRAIDNLDSSMKRGGVKT